MDEKGLTFNCGSCLKIRVYVENAIRRVRTFRIMGDVYRNSMKKYDHTNDIVCGLVNQRFLVYFTRAGIVNLSSVVV